MTSRGLVKLLCLMLALAVVGAAFVVPGRTAAASADPGPAQIEPDIFRIGFGQEPDSMNPFAGVLSASYFVYSLVYDLLVGIGTDLQPTPQLAKSWSVAADNVTWTFDLQENVTWHDGQPFTADDVKFTIEYIQTCGLGLFLGYVGNPATDPVYIESVTVLSPTRVEIKTNVPKVNMLSLYVPIVPQHIWQPISCARAEREANVPPIGTGIYRFRDWVQPSYLQLDLNTNYTMVKEVLAGDPTKDFVDQIIMQFYTDPIPLYQDFTNGVLDATDELTTADFSALPLNVDADPEADVGKFVADSIELSEIGFAAASDADIARYLPPPDGDRHWLMTNLTTRQAIAMAIDKQTLIDSAYSGLARVGDSLIPSATPYWHYDVPPAERFDFDLQRAADLLNDPVRDGYTLRAGAIAPGLKGEGLDPAAANNSDAFADIDNDGVREVIDPSKVKTDHGPPYSTPKGNENLATAANEMDFGVWIIDEELDDIAAADIFVNWLASIGIRVQKVLVSEARMLQVSYAADYDLYMWGWGGDVDPDFLLSVMTTDQILGWQDAWYSNATYDQLYLDQQGLVVLAERQAVVHEMQRILYYEQPYIVYMYPFATTAVRTDRFTNWGNWSAMPGLGLSGFGNGFLYLQLEPVAGAPNTCPTDPVILGSAARTVYANETSSFAARSVDGEGDPLNWTWDWDDLNSTRLDTVGGVAEASASHAWERPGTYDVTVVVDDRLCGQLKTSAAVRLTVLPEPAVAGWLVGTVTDAGTGDPLSEALVSIGPRQETTAADGTYNITLPPGVLTVTVSKALYLTDSRQVTITDGAETTADFALVTSRGWLAGRVTAAATGGAIADAIVEIVDAATGQPTPTRTNATGHYNVTVSPGTYNVTASATGYVTQTRTGLAVVDGATTTADFALAVLPGPAGWDPLVLSGIAVAILILIGVAAVLLMRKRKKAEEIPPPVPPPPSPPKP